jgi:hypothetical protein
VLEVTIYAIHRAVLEYNRLVISVLGVTIYAIHRAVLGYNRLVISVLGVTIYAIHRAERHGFVGNRGESARYERVSVDSNPSSSRRAGGTHL